MNNIILDPGHGGSDSGAVNTEYNIRESDIVLQISNILFSIFRTHPEYAVIPIRDSDEFVDLRERTELANQTKSYLISLHCNAAASPEAHGVETWCFSEKDANGDESEGYKLAKSIQSSLGGVYFADRLCV